eukprot:301940-Amphidinium_carterae.1
MQRKRDDKIPSSHEQCTVEWNLNNQGRRFFGPAVLQLQRIARKVERSASRADGPSLEACVRTRCRCDAVKQADLAKVRCRAPPRRSRYSSSLFLLPHHTGARLRRSCAIEATMGAAKVQSTYFTASSVSFSSWLKLTLA